MANRSSLQHSPIKLAALSEEEKRELLKNIAKRVTEEGKQD